MRKLAIVAALASTAIATPAVARDHSFYAGLEGGAMIVEDLNLDYRSGTTTIPTGYIVNFGTGYDIDAIAGYDFGVLRLEGELAYKHAGVDGVNADARISPVGNGNLSGGRVNVFSGMINALLDFGNDNGLSGYFGGGVGWASVDLTVDEFESAHDSDDHYSVLPGHVMPEFERVVEKHERHWVVEKFTPQEVEERLVTDAKTQ